MKRFDANDSIEKEFKLEAVIAKIKMLCPHEWERLGELLRSKCYPWPIGLNENSDTFKSCYIERQTYARIATLLGFFEDKRSEQQ